MLCVKRQVGRQFIRLSRTRRIYSNKVLVAGAMERDDTYSKKTTMAKLFKVRKRREMLLVQVCFVCSVLFVAWSMSALLTKTGE